jgi:hypothetical protein
MKRQIPWLIAILVLGSMTAVRSKPSSPLPPHPSSKAISSVGMTPDYEPAAADAGKATEEIASTMPAATAEQHDAA